MPELPEVEVLRRGLAPELEGRSFRRVEVRAPRLREPLRRAVLRRRLEGARVLAVRRRAKYLLIDVEPRSTLAVHLGMSGRLELAPSTAERRSHEHVVFELDDGRDLRFRDPRRFGNVFAVPTARLDRDRHFAHLGIEPLSDDFSGATLRRLAQGRRVPVKSFLMDARVVVGVGNIYASEALHRARIHPGRAAGRVSERRFEMLAEAVRAVLSEAIEEGGTTLSDFVGAHGEPGYFAVSLAVYGREGERCGSCGGPIRRMVQGGRSTYYCASCQR